MIEAPFMLLDEQVKVVLGDAIIIPQVTLGLVPEILDPVDVVTLLGKEQRVIDAQMMEL